MITKLKKRLGPNRGCRAMEGKEETLDNSLSTIM
jgi:hypothetical protein